jgi:hypothetical protein
MQGVERYAASQILRYKSPRMTQRYAHLSRQYVADKLEKLDRVFSGVLPSKDTPVAPGLVPKARTQC